MWKRQDICTNCLIPSKFVANTPASRRFERPRLKPLRFYLGGPRINKLPCGRWCWCAGGETTGDQAKEQSSKSKATGNARFVQTSTNTNKRKPTKFCAKMYHKMYQT